MAARSAKLPADQIAEIERRHERICFRGTPEQGYRDSGFWEFLQYVYTKDEHDVVSPVKAMPWEKEYMMWTFVHMLACEKLLVPKSRQIMVSWMLAAFACWFVRTQPHCLVIVQSKKAEDAHELVSMGRDNPCAGRVDFIEQHLPRWLRDPHIIQGQGNKVGQLIYTPQKKTPQGVKVPWYGSRIMAVPQGADQVRGKTVSLYISDEAAFQDEFGNAVNALLPALMSPKSTTRFIAASSVCSGSEFNKMVLESAQGLGDGELYVEPENTGCIETKGIVQSSKKGALPDGIRSWDTPSGFATFEVHYRSDPEKNPGTPQGAEWIKRAVKAYAGGMKSPGWQQEMEIDYAAAGGLPVFPFLSDPDSPVLIPSLSMRDVKRRKMLLVAGYDYGSHNPAAFVVWGQDPVTKDWYALDEVYEPCRGYSSHVQKILNTQYMRTGMVSYVRCDHSLGYQNQQGAGGIKSIVDIFGKEGLHMVPGRKRAGDTLRIMMLDWWSDVEQWREWDVAAAQAHARGEDPPPRKPRCYITSSCPKLWWELQRLRLKEHTSAQTASRRNQPDEIMDKDDHAFQASAYVLDTRPEAKVARARYGSRWTWNDVEERLEARERERQLSREYVV